MSELTTSDHDGHDLIHAAELPPPEALDTWEHLLSVDYDSRRSDAVLISSAGSFIGASAYLDHGVEKALEIVALAAASAFDGMWGERNGDEATRDLDELIAEAEGDCERWLGSEITHRIFPRYSAALRERELNRRASEAEDEDSE